MSDTSRKHRRFWLFGLMAFAVFFAACLWGRSQLNLVNERREFLREFGNGEGRDLVIGLSTHRLPPHEGLAVAPWLARMLGEKGIGFIWIDRRAPAGTKATQIARLKEIFPEAEVAEAPQEALRVYDQEHYQRMKEEAGR